MPFIALSADNRVNIIALSNNIKMCQSCEGVADFTFPSCLGMDMSFSFNVTGIHVNECPSTIVKFNSDRYGIFA